VRVQGNEKTPGKGQKLGFAQDIEYERALELIGAFAGLAGGTGLATVDSLQALDDMHPAVDDIELGTTAAVGKGLFDWSLGERVGHVILPRGTG
jgi:hypothetical protein